MDKYKLVPVFPTEEMLEAGHYAVVDGCHPGGIYADVLATAPDVQGEPVGWQFYQDGKWWYGDDRIKLHRKNTEAAGMPVRDLYAAPTREEQKEPDSLCVEDDGCPTEKAVLQRFWRKHHQTAPDVAEPKSPTPKESWWAGYRAGKGLPANTPRQDAIAAPDMPVLTEALRQYRNNDGSKLVFGYDKLLVDQHVAQLVEALEAVMEFGCDPKSNRGMWALEKAESALAAYHNQGGAI